MINDIIIALIGAIPVSITGLLLHYREMKKKDIEIEKHIQEKKEHQIKGDVLDKVLNFSAFNKIKTAVDEIFNSTKADRFLILIALNGKLDFNIVSVIFEQHKSTKYQVNAIARYRSLKIDAEYRKLLKDAEKFGLVHVKTEDLNPSLLKGIYTIENIVYSEIRHLLRLPIDDNNDILIYSSLATHDEEEFTELERTQANIIYDSSIRNILSNVLKEK
jgi:hypothetical protein